MPSNITNYKQLLLHFCQRTGSTHAYSEPTSTGSPHCPMWAVTLTVHVSRRAFGTHEVIPSGDTWTDQGVAPSKKGAREAVCTSLLQAHRAQVKALFTADDRPTTTYHAAVNATWKPSETHTVYIGAEHAHRLATLGRGNGDGNGNGNGNGNAPCPPLVSVDTEGFVEKMYEFHDDRPYTGRFPAVQWMQCADANTIVILPFAPCVEAITAFLARADITKVFCDAESDSLRLPPVAWPVADIQRTFSNRFPTYVGPVSIYRMLERYHDQHATRLVKPSDSFYEGFKTDDVTQLTLEHRRYMEADAYATWRLATTLGTVPDATEPVRTLFDELLY